MKDFPFDTSRFQRRQFLTTAGAALGAATAGTWFPVSQARAEDSAATSSLVAENDVVLFQGDSITDAGRSRETAATPNDQAALGTGYAGFAAESLLVDRPNDGLKVYNRGISGNKVFQLSDRWQADCLDLKPNVLSILIGVNDLWHTLDGKYNGTVEIYEKDYRALLERTRRALPKIKLVVCEPFVLRCGSVNDKWFPVFDQYRVSAKAVAAAYDARFVAFQTMFDNAVKFAPPQHWARDGVHPTPSGGSLMAHNWLKVVTGK